MGLIREAVFVYLSFTCAIKQTLEVALLSYMKFKIWRWIYVGGMITEGLNTYLENNKDGKKRVYE